MRNKVSFVRKYMVCVVVISLIMQLLCVTGYAESEQIVINAFIRQNGSQRG